ncbi:PREDICTED: cellular nucleic acid-binding protein-like [Wasmannia auropunctata]|uniref:cellular nucleic acid-binding protein-like n=1 Tax=Wasmannia auropunctata TaxID=64793 RepID=UPI0005EFC329|nr:PREDICTED: cellular nucleic acid-binding protein-like [Wasmannia auropunctata]
MANTGGCAMTDIRLGQYRITRNGARTVWTQCPLNAAMQLAQEGKLRVGWSTARVVLLKKRPVQCFRCMASGHVRERCPSEVDRSASCFNCGADGHIARNCGRPPECPICKEQGRRHDHRAGSEACPPCPPRNLRGGSQNPMPQRIPVDRSSAAAPDVEA